MIRFFIMNGKNSVRFDMPTDELFDHLGSIGIRKDIPIGGSGDISAEYYSTDDKDEIADIVCKRLLPTDKISDVNALCHKLDGLWRITTEELEAAFAENDVHGAVNMDEVYESLKEEIRHSNDLKM